MTRGRKPASIVPGSSPVESVPKPPSWLSRDAKAEWKRVAPILVNERRTLTMADLAAFTAFCIAVGHAAEAQRIINREGLVFVASKGALPKKHAAFSVQMDALREARLLAGELGLTPVSRSRPAVRDDESDADALIHF